MNLTGSSNLVDIQKGSHRRLQRQPDFTGGRLSTFRDILFRHGLPGLFLAGCFVVFPELQAALLDSLGKAAAAPARYLILFAAIGIALNLYIWRLDRQLRLSQLGWVAYLGVLSFWEEWVFRIAIPQTLESWGIAVWGAAAISAVLFGSAHYFTLRWKWQWCIIACIGGFALSRQMEMRGDLLLITAFHWVATFLNTPRPPGQAAIKKD